MKKQVPTKNVGQCDILHAAGSYEAPATWRNSIETEGGICSGSVNDEKATTNEVHAHRHDVQTFEDDPFDYSESDWD